MTARPVTARRATAGIVTTRTVTVLIMTTRIMTVRDDPTTGETCSLTAIFGARLLFEQVFDTRVGVCPG